MARKQYRGVMVFDFEVDGKFSTVAKLEEAWDQFCIDMEAAGAKVSDVKIEQHKQSSKIVEERPALLRILFLEVAEAQTRKCQKARCSGEGCGLKNGLIRLNSAPNRPGG